MNISCQAETESSRRETDKRMVNHRTMKHVNIKWQEDQGKKELNNPKMDWPADPTREEGEDQENRDHVAKK